MTCRRVEIAPDAYFVCLSHALITDQEEVMGLLVGETVPEGTGSVARVAGVHILTRSDKKPDRCEISATQLAGASAEAERLAVLTGREIRIIGWYHSHPHITVLPSHVDVRTQGAWQMMDDSFVGLIFSVFNEEASKTQRIQTIAFQSTRVEGCETFTQLDVPLTVVQHGWPQTLLGVRSPQTLSSLVRVLFEEEKAMAHQAKAESTLQQMHNTSIHNKFLSKFMEYAIIPIRQHFAHTQVSCERRLESIRAQKLLVSEELERVRQRLTEQQPPAPPEIDEQTPPEEALPTAAPEAAASRTTNSTADAPAPAEDVLAPVANETASPPPVAPVSPSSVAWKASELLDASPRSRQMSAQEPTATQCTPLEETETIASVGISTSVGASNEAPIFSADGDLNEPA